jgi:hypothetical protein
MTSWAGSDATGSAVEPSAATTPRTKTPVSLPSTVRKPARLLRSDSLMISTVLGPGEPSS